MVHLTTNVANVDVPLISVAQIVYNGVKVVLSLKSCRTSTRTESRIDSRSEMGCTF